MNSDVLGHHTGAPEYRFTARIHRLGANAYVDAPPRVSAAFGRRGAVAVKGTLNGVPIRATLVAAGGGGHPPSVKGIIGPAGGGGGGGGGGPGCGPWDGGGGAAGGGSPPTARSGPAPGGGISS